MVQRVSKLIDRSILNERASVASCWFVVFLFDLSVHRYQIKHYKPTRSHTRTRKLSPPSHFGCVLRSKCEMMVVGNCWYVKIMYYCPREASMNFVMLTSKEIHWQYACLWFSLSKLCRLINTSQISMIEVKCLCIINIYNMIFPWMHQAGVCMDMQF